MEGECCPTPSGRITKEMFLISPRHPGGETGGAGQRVPAPHLRVCEGTDVVWLDAFRSFRKRNTQGALRSLRTLNCVCVLGVVTYLLRVCVLSVKYNTDHPGLL